jgi:hypothetical protein
MTPGDNEPQRLGDFWDALLTGHSESSPESSADRDLLSTIRDLYLLDDAPTPDSALQATIWHEITGEAMPVADFVPLPVTLPSSNGKVAHANAPSLRPVGPASVRTWQRGVEIVLGVVRFLAIGAVAGFGAGFITGIGARLAMRVSGYLTSSNNRGLLTDNDNVVGQITLAGTLSLALQAGAIGVLGGLIYLSIRSRLPGTGRWRGLIYGGLLLATFGFVVMDEHNPDYRRFGPPALNVMTFSLIYVLFGVVAAPLTDLIDRITPRWSLTRPHRVRAWLLFVVMTPFAVIGAFAVLFAIAVGGLASVAILAGLGVVAPLIWWVLRRLGQSHRPWLQPAFAGYVVVGASCLIGFFLTARGIAGILGVG